MEQASDIAGKKILIVEDDPLLHTLLSDKMKQLREKGVEVVPVMNAEEALQKAPTLVPDLVMLDLVLPGMNGFEFLEALRKTAGFEKTPVIILSNLGADSDKERARSLGVTAYLVKANYSLSDISAAVEEVLRGHAVPQASGAPDVQKTSQGYMVYL
jgi:DNA-binding response OmpR family regulator